MTRNCMECAENAPQNPEKGKKNLVVVFSSLFLLALCVVVRYYWGADSASAEPPARTVAPAADREPATPRPIVQPEARGNVAKPAPAKPAPASQPAKKSAAREETAARQSPIPEIVAAVNMQRITREELQKECLHRHGSDMLESMVNKHLILQECRRQGLEVTRDGVNEEIERMAKQFKIPVDQWLTLLKQERNITPAQYADDIIWPALALRKLAGERLSISREELVKEFETQYGEAIRARLIAVGDQEKAEKLHAQAKANPDDFGNLAKDYSEDAPSASLKGVIQPIRRHGSFKEIEDAIFTMADGDISPVIRAGGQYVILKREGSIPPRQVKLEQVVPQLDQILRDRKMQSAAQEIFQQLQEKAKGKIENVWNDPAKREKMPGVAARVNGDPIALGELARECVGRHGSEVLDGMIGRKILEQACKKQNIVVTEADIDQEIARAAAAGIKSKPDGSPDVDSWLELMTRKQGIPLDVYRNDVVWPSVALKKLSGDKVQVTDQDLQKGYEANHGPRVRCLAIVMSNARRAQQVFDLARRDNTEKNFGELASQYSEEPGSKALRGEVPPIKKFGGQPILEEEAFKLKPGELSGLIQVGDKFAILRCMGHTKAVPVDFDKVRDDIYQDLLEKKTRLAMAEYYEKLQESASVDNFLTGSSQSPKRPADAASASRAPAMRQVPARQ